MLQGTRTWNRQLMAGVLAVWMLLCAIPQPILAAAGDALAESTALSLQAMSSGNGYSAEDTYGEKLANLRYDDHIDMTGKTVEVIDAGTPTSYQVGYGVGENAIHDTAVVTLEGETLVATGIGNAKVRIDGTVCEISVTAAPISLILLTGQSNMRGSEGNANQSIVCPDGMVYATYGDDRGADNTAMTVNNATMFVPSALTGEYCNINVEGTTDCLSGYPIYSLTEAGAGKIGPDSGFAYEWVKQTGEKVWIVNAAHGGTSISVWQDGKTEFEECERLFKACQETLRKEIAAGHFVLSHMAYFWCQGCSDRGQSAEWYVKRYLAMHNSFKDVLTFDHDSDPATANKTFEFGGIIPVRVGSTVSCYRDGAYEISNPYAYHESFVDLRFSGPRVAQYWMINNPDLPDIWGVCNIGDDWVWMPDGTNGVSAYFNTHYPGGTVDYTTQVQQSNSWYTPTTPKAVHDSIHYNQIGYNEIGRESVRNALILLGETEAPAVEPTVKLLTWDGYTEAAQVPASTTGNSATLVVPVVSPIWKSKDVTYELSEGLRWNYYDLLADTAETEGVLTAIGAQGSVHVAKGTPGKHFSDHLSQLPENVCCDLNLWSVLEHDKYYYASGTNWSIYSGRDVPSVTIPVNPGDRIFATSFGKVGENGHATSNGIRVTFFSAYGIAKTMAPAETYAEFAANGGYLIAPEDAVAINIPMWNNSDDNEIYILNLDHTYKNGICTGCGSNVLDGNYTHAIPENQGVQNAIDRAYALTDVEWTPLADVPGVQKINGEFAVVPFKGGITYRGIPYSGVTANDCYVGLNVSLESFLTALKNKNSVLYTENLFNTNPKSATYFGTVCSKFAQYVLDIPGSYNTNNIANIPGMETIALPGKYTVDQIKLGDVVLHTQDHTTVCTDILYDADGNVAYIEISEAVMPLVRRNYWSPEEFYAHFSGYRLCRYQYISEVPAFQKTEPASDYALMPRFGDKYNYKVSAAKGVVDVLKSGYYKAIILRDGTVIDEIILNGATTFLFDRSIPGSLEMYLEKEDGTHSASVFACVVKSSVTVDDASKFANGKLTITIDGSCGTPVYVQVGSAHAIFCNVEGTDGTVNISFPFSKVSSQQVRVAYQNEYGIYLSSWVSFTADENPSDDPLLSQAQYWNGYNITPNNPTPVIQENKVGYWSYTMIPVIGGETYYSAGATRMWFLDENGNPISTYNAYLDGEIPFRFTVPENAVYVNIAYSPLIEQGSETIEIVHNYKSVVTPPTCTEQGYTTHTCACGDSYVDSYVPATGHKFSVYTTDGNATYEADGTKTALCDHGCGAKDTVADVGSMLFPEQVTSSVYTISGGVLSKVPTGTTVSQLLSGLDWGKYCTVFDTNGNAVDASAKVATGMVVKLLRDSEVMQMLTIAVRGDTSGDGAVTLTDFVQIKAHLLQKQTLTGAAVTAADYSADGSVTVTDFMQVKALLLKMPA